MSSPPRNIIQPKYTTGNKDVESQMIELLDDKSLFNLCLTNRDIAEVCRNDALWEKRLLKRFPSFHSLKPEGMSYKNYYLRTISRIHKLLYLREIEELVSNEIQLKYILLQEKNEEPLFKKNKDAVLLSASKRGYLEIVQYIFEKIGNDPDTRIDWALQWAAEEGHIQVVRYIVERVKLPLNVLNKALMLASAHGHLPVVQYLVEKAGANPHVKNGWSLMVASTNGHLPVVRYLIEKARVDPRVMKSRFEMIGDPEVVKYLSDLL